MSLLHLYERGVDWSKLTESQRKFCHEYVTDYNGARAAIAAGYTVKSAAARACRLLKLPLVERLVGKLQKDALEKSGLNRGEVLAVLHNQLHTRFLDFFDGKGNFITNPRDLPEHVQKSINGFKVRVTEDLKTGVTQTIYDVKLVPHETVTDMSMKHVGGYAPEQHEHKVAAAVVDWAAMKEQDGRAVVPATVAQRVESPVPSESEQEAPVDRDNGSQGSTG